MDTKTTSGSDKPIDLTTNEPTDRHTSNMTNESSPSFRRSGRKRKQAYTKDPLMVNTETPVKKRKSKPKNVDAEFDTLWICSECKEAECMMKQDAEQLLICEGSCRRLFHYPCAGLAQLPAEDEAYVCKDCKERKHACSICGDYGEDDLDIFLCSKATCGLFFHEACLSMQNVHVRIVDDESHKASSASNNNEEAEQQIPSGKRVFVCPAHACWTCNQVDLRKQESEAAKEAAKEETKNSRKRKKKKPTSAVFSSKPEHHMIVSSVLSRSEERLKFFLSSSLLRFSLSFYPALSGVPDFVSFLLHSTLCSVSRVGYVVPRTLGEWQTA